MNNKLKIQILDVELEISNKFLSGTKIYMNHAATANAVKQYVKKRFPSVVVSVNSSTFAGGNSVDIYLSDKYGRPVYDEIAREIKTFGDLFVYGKFDGMNDIYEYYNSSFQVGEYTIDAGVKYLHVNNRPRHGSVESTLQSLIAMTQTNDYVFGQVSLQEAIGHCRRFGIKQDTIDKSLKMYSQLTETIAQ